jgi:MFS family permease
VTHRPLRQNRDYVLLQVGQGLSTLGSESTQIAYPLLVLALTHSPERAGIVAFMRFFPYVVFALPAGVAVDRWNRKRLMLLCDGGRALALASLVATLALGHVTFAQIVAVAFVEGSLYALFNIAETGALRAVVPPGQLPRAAAGEQSRIATVQLAAPPLGGVLFGFARLVPFAFDVASYVFSVFSLLAIRTPFQEQRERATTRVREEIAEGFHWLRGRPFLWVIQLVAAGANLVFEALLLTLIVVAKRDGLSSAQIGLLIGGLGATLLLGSLAAPLLQRRVSIRIATALETGTTLSILAYVFVPNVYVLVGALLPTVFIVPTVSSSVIGYRLAIAPEALVGRVNSVARTIALVGAPLGSLAAGFMLGAWSPQTTVAILCVLAVVLLVWTLGSPSLRESPDLTQLDELATPSASRAAAG